MELSANVVAVRGQSATVKWGYHRACELASWSFAGSGIAGGTVTATVVSRDAFKLSQDPLTLVLVFSHDVEEMLRKAPQLRDVPWIQEISDRSSRQVRWPVASFTEDNGTATIIVGPCERKRE